MTSELIKCLGERVVDIANKYGVTEVECESLVRQWVKDIDSSDLDTSTTSVLMFAKRIRYGLVEI